MLRYNNHFLDSCSIIGKLLDFDAQYNYAVTYFNKNFQRHISERVEHEVYGRLNGLRQELMSFFMWIKTKNFKGIPTEHKVTGFLNTYRYHDRERNYRSLNRFFSLNMEKIKSYLLDKKDSTLNELEDCVVNTIQKAQNKLRKMLYLPNPQIICHPTPSRYLRLYNVEFTKVNTLIGYEKDALILLDSYYVKNQVIGTDIGFITTDYGDILSKANSIQSKLPGIYIFKMG